MSNSSVSNYQGSTEQEDNLFVVGIGASAGGLSALEELFSNLSTASGAAFVVIQHLSPDFKSLMKELVLTDFVGGGFWQQSASGSGRASAPVNDRVLFFR